MALASLIATLTALAVPLLNPAQGARLGMCPPNLEASYHLSQNALAICRPQPSQAALATLVKHEAVHVAQDCKAGLHNGRMAALAPSKNPFVDAPVDVHGSAGTQLFLRISTAYSPKHWAAEYEAWLLQGAPASTINEIVRSHCAPWLD